jgi:hypothetical protein
MGRETYGLGNVCGKGHVIAEDRIETTGAGIDAVTDHMIVTVVTSCAPNKGQTFQYTKNNQYVSPSLYCY